MYRINGVFLLCPTVFTNCRLSDALSYVYAYSVPVIRQMRQARYLMMASHALSFFSFFRGTDVVFCRLVIVFVECRAVSLVV